MKVIFLDIDGVLNTWTTCHLPPSFEKKHKIEAYLSPKSIELVNKLAKENDAKIVISSSWRMHDKDLHVDPEYAGIDLRDFLGRSGLTAKFAEDWHTPIPERFGELLHGRPRGFEISDWLENHPEVTKWVSLDDDVSGFESKGILNHLAKTNPRMGFLEEDFEKANNILKGKK